MLPLSCVCITVNLSRGRAVTNVGRTCGPTPLLVLLVILSCNKICFYTMPPPPPTDFLKNHDEWFVDSRSALNPSVLYATDRFMAVVLVLFLFCIALWFLLRGVSCFVLPCSLFSCLFFFFFFFVCFFFFFFFSPFSILITSLGEGKESWSMCSSYICLFILQAFPPPPPFSSSCCRGLAAALPGLFF